MKTFKRSRQKSLNNSILNRSLSAKRLHKNSSHQKQYHQIIQDEKKIKQSNSNMQLLTKKLDTYTLLIRSSHPIRCLIHNCNISLYCQTQQKLLCANCVFSKNDHKFHRVTPVDKSCDKIQKDIQTMNRLIDRQLQNMKNTIDNLKGQLIKQESQTHSGMSTLISLYQECHQLLEKNFIISKQKILNRFENSRQRYQSLSYQVTQLIQAYSLSKAIKNINKEPCKRQQLLLYQHAVASVVVGQKKIDQKDYVYNKKQLTGCIAEQKRKIMQLLDMMKKLY